MSEINTPRTDKESWKTATREEVVWASFARQLERELIQAQQIILFHSDQCDKLQEDNERLGSRIEQLDEENFHLKKDNEEAQHTIAQQAGQIQRLREVLKEVWGKLPRDGSFVSYSNRLPELTSLIESALSTPAPVAVVPWEVVVDYIDKLEYSNATAKVAMSNSDALNSANEQLNKAYTKLQSYAPKKGNQ